MTEASSRRKVGGTIRASDKIKPPRGRGGVRSLTSLQGRVVSGSSTLLWHGGDRGRTGRTWCL